MIDLLQVEQTEETGELTEAQWRAAADTQHNVLRFACAMWIAALVLALFNSGQLVNVVNGLGAGPVQDAVVALAATWNEQMDKNGLNEPVELVRGAIMRLHDMSWQELGAEPSQDRGAHLLRGSAVDGAEG
jgi:hypothetical protein